MKYQEYRFTLDLQKHQSQTTINVFQGDTAVRLYINFTDGGKPYTLEGRNFAIFYGKRDDGKPLVHKCEVISKAEIMYEFQPATTFVLGIVNCQCRIYSNDQKLITAPRFSINVEEKVVDDDDFPISDDEKSLLDEILAGDADRNIAEENRQTEELNRIDQESIRQLNEFGGTNADGETIEGRVNGELAREAAEADRKTAELDRGNAEAIRVSNEDVRQANEDSRVEAETRRNENIAILSEKIAQRDVYFSELENEVAVHHGDIRYLLGNSDATDSLISQLSKSVNKNTSDINALSLGVDYLRDKTDELESQIEQGGSGGGSGGTATDPSALRWVTKDKVDPNKPIYAIKTPTIFDGYCWEEETNVNKRIPNYVIYLTTLQPFEDTGTYSVFPYRITTHDCMEYDINYFYLNRDTLDVDINIYFSGDYSGEGYWQFTPIAYLQ